MARPLLDWPDRAVEVELWPDLLRLEVIDGFLAARHDAAGRLREAVVSAV